jgi:hypothetical protein
MLSLFLLPLVQVAPNPQIACPDLSGKYVIQGEDGRVHITIVQTHCKRVAIEWNNNPTADSKHTLPLDGRFRVDSGWFGFRERLLTAAQMHPDGLEIIAKPASSADTSVFLWKHMLELLPNGDLCARLLDSRGKPASPMLAARRKSSGRTGETEAARRSERGCA